MRQIVVFLFIFGFLYLYPNTKESNIIGLLESGNFGEVEKIILFSKDEEYKNFLISLLHLYKGDYETAESYIVKISSIWYDRNDYLPSSEKKFFISYIFGIKSLLSNYTVIESEHFKIWLKGRDIILKDLVIQKLEEIYNFYNKIFGYNILEKIRVEIYNTKEEFYFASTLGKEVVDKTGVVGICKFNKIMILSPENLPLGYRWCDTLSHEYLHLLLNRLTEFTYPLYLHEGTARYFDTLYRSSEPLCFTPGNLKLLLEAKNNNKLISFKDMRGSLAYLETQQQVELAFTELATFVEYLIMNFGIDRFIHFIRKYKEYNTQEIKLYKYVFGKDFDDIISEWLKYIDTKFEVVKNYPGAQPDIKIFAVEQETELIGLETRQYIQIGDRFLYSNNYNAALYQYKKAQQKEIYNPVILTRIGKVYFLLKKYDEAKSVLERCIIANPNFVSAYELLLKVYYEKGEYENALQIYRHILEINPFNHEIRKIVGSIYSDLGRLKDAIREYEVVSILDPSDSKTRVVLDSIKRYLELKNLPKQ